MSEVVAVYDPNVFCYGGGDTPTDPRQRDALKLVEGMGGGGRGQTRVAFIADQVVIASTDPEGQGELSLDIWPIDELIAVFSDRCRTEMGSIEFDQFMAEGPGVPEPEEEGQP